MGKEAVSCKDLVCKRAKQYMDDGEKIGRALARAAKEEMVSKRTAERYWYGESSSDKPVGRKRARSNNIFNETNDSVGWARWTWNPYTGCEHGCKYCYARDIANRFYKEKFKPTFKPHRLKQPKLTPLPKQKGWHRRVFVCSMADLFGDWVDIADIQKILNAAGNSEWTYIYLTKNPKRLLEIDWPPNSWVGATVDNQERANNTEPIFQKLKAPLKFYSVEPFTESIEFQNLQWVDCILVGGRSRSTRMPAKYPTINMLCQVLRAAEHAGTRWFLKNNITAPISK